MNDQNFNFILCQMEFTIICIFAKKSNHAGRYTYEIESDALGHAGNPKNKNCQ